MTQAPPKLVAEPPPILCFHCEYDLRGLSREGRCPECGSEIEISWQREEERRLHGIVPLVLAPRSWLKWMTGGCITVLACFVLTLLEALVVGGQIRIPVWIGVQMAQLCTLVAGLWMLGAREPASTSFANSSLVRWSIRWTLLLDVIVLTMGYRMNAYSNLVRFFTRWAKVQGFVYGVVTLWLLLRLEEASRRSRRAALRRGILALLWTMPLAIALQPLLHVEIYMQPYSSWILTPHPVIGFAEVIIVLPFGLLHGVGKDLRGINWAIQAMLSLSMIAVIAMSGWMFMRAARRDGKT
jgi:hypothetical protein